MGTDNTDDDWGGSKEVCAETHVLSNSASDTEFSDSMPTAPTILSSCEADGDTGMPSS